MKKFLTIVLFAFAAITAQAQALQVSTGGSGGTYSRMFKELSNACSTQLQLTEVTSSGSTQNIDRLTGNEVNAAFVQTDVMHFRGRTEDLSNIKTLVSLHPEEVHVVSLAVLKEKEGGTLGFGAKAVQLNTVNDLANRTVVAAGGSYITAQVIRLQAEIPFNVVEVKTADEALAAVAAGTAHAAVLVGGQPLGAPAAPGAKPTLVSALDKNFKLLSFPEATVAKLKNVYQGARLNYSNVGAAGVQSIATDALFVTRQYTTPKMVNGLTSLRKCFVEKLPELQETTGLHKAWSKVSADNKGKWPYAEFSQVAKK